jgi:ubiquinone/menaquinone biosynthesis C-methylase UbiE
MEGNHSNRVCPVERSGALDSSLRRVFQNPAKILKPYLKPGDKVLDFGCGPGFFTFDIAQLVGKSGLVYAADLQEGMLKKVEAKITFLNMESRIKLHKCEQDAIGLNDTVDFILAFYMIHELINQENTFLEFKTILNPDGRLLIIEPDFHVSRTDFHNMLMRLEKVGFKIIERPKLIFSRSVLLQKNN